MEEIIEEIDCEATDGVVCPYCGYEFEESYSNFKEGAEVFEDLVCHDCGREFISEKTETITYSSFKAKREKCDRCKGTKEWQPFATNDFVKKSEGDKFATWNCDLCDENGEVLVSK